jgi:hypothetical protein
MQNKQLIKELQDHLEKLEAVIEFHILSASKFIDAKYKIQQKIKELKDNE